MFNTHDISRDTCQLFAGQAHLGYDWWWHSFTAQDAETGEDKPFFIEFFLCNPAHGKDEPVFGQLPENKANHVHPSYLMVKVGTWGEDARQIHRFFGWNQVRIGKGAPIRIKADDCILTETGMKGKVKVSEEEAAAHPEWMCEAGELEFDLKIDKKIAFNVGYGASHVMRDAQAFEMFWHAEGMKTEYKGKIRYNGRKYKVTPEKCYGYADKNWGKNFTTPWVWLSSNDLVSEITGKKLTDSVFDIGGGRPKIGPVELSGRLLSAFWYEGKEYEFNFSKFWTGVKTKFECHETDTQVIWHVEQSNHQSKMITDIECDKKDMLLINYEAPDGTRKHNRLWNGGNGRGCVQLFEGDQLIDRIHAEHVGCEYGEYDEE